MSLHDLEARSHLEFKASVVSAYERGERAISLPRLLRLAAFYGVPPDQLLPRAEVEIDLSDAALVSPQRVVVDSALLDTAGTPEATALAGLVSGVRAQRREHDGRFVAIRADDLRVLAATLGSSPDDLTSRLETRGLVTTGARG